MFELESNKETIYFLPEDGEIARSKFLELLSLPTKGWINSYGFNMEDAFHAIYNNEANNIPTDLLLDYTQSRGPKAVQLVKELVIKIKVGDVTLTTAGINSKQKSAIFHWKAMVKEAIDGGDPWCLEGSVNFSNTGWLQGNTMRVFRSSVYAQKFIEYHGIHKNWARQNEKQYQVTSFEEGKDFVDVYFDLLKRKKNVD